MDNKLRDQFRNFLKDSVRTQIDFSRTDQNLGLSPPPLQKPYSPGKDVIKLPEKGNWPNVKNIDLISAIENRKSRRKYKTDPLQIDQLSFLLWATQGIRHFINPGHAFRTVPSAGCRHAFETYLCILNIEGLKQGIYRYLPVEHGLILEQEEPYLYRRIVDASFGQSFLATSAVTFVWTAIPSRMEWRYDIAAHRVIAFDAGHMCQNLYLACEAIGAGICAIGAYNQPEMDELLGVDGEDEFTIYMAPVGTV